VTTFSASKHAGAVVEADQKEIWAALTDPDLMARLTKYVKRITETGDTWRWELSGLEVLGRSIAPSFTERMVFEEPHRIEFHHEPPGRREPAGVNGWYQLTALEDGATRLETDMSICVELPLPKVSGRAVERVMRSVLDSMGDGFSANLLEHLGTTERR
jgi:carbon monoxide dehydrogenase subunit G